MTPQQPPLFDDAAADRAECEQGRHGSLIASPAICLGEAVNVDWNCVRCGRCVQTTSYTREAWAKQRDKSR